MGFSERKDIIWNWTELNWTKLKLRRTKLTLKVLEYTRGSPGILQMVLLLHNKRKKFLGIFQVLSFAVLTELQSPSPFLESFVALTENSLSAQDFALCNYFNY